MTAKESKHYEISKSLLVLHMRTSRLHRQFRLPVTIAGRIFISLEWVCQLVGIEKDSGPLKGGHSGSWPPLHCGDSKNLAPEAASGAPLYSEAPSPERGREHQETGDRGPTRHAGAGLRGLLGPTAHGLLGRRHPGPRPSTWLGEAGA